MQEFVDFLKGIRPYADLTDADRAVLARSVRVEFVAAGAIVLREGDAVDVLRVVRAGRFEELSDDRCVDLIEVGDTFGYTALLSGDRALRSVRAMEDSLIYLLDDPRAILVQPDALRFDDFEGHLERERIQRLVSVGRERHIVSGVMRPAVIAQATDLICDVAGAITRAAQSCAVIPTGAGVGIVTDSDMRARVATGDVHVSQPVVDLASVPAITISQASSTAAAFAKMMRANVKHLVVVDDAHEPLGVVRFADVAPLQARDPMLVRGAVERAQTVAELREATARLPRAIAGLYDNGVAPMQIGGLVSAVIDAALVRLVALRNNSGHVELSQWSLVVLGSLARREPLPGSDIDTALVIADGLSDQDTELVSTLAGPMLRDVESLGFRACVDGANADNPLFARTTQSWSAALNRWISRPLDDGHLLLTSIVSDNRPITRPSLGRAIGRAVSAQALTDDFRAMFTRYCVDVRPPVGFMGNLVVERSGEHRGSLNMKRGGLVPCAALGRWIAVMTGEYGGSTAQRLARGAEAGLLSRDEADSMAGAFEVVYGIAYAAEVAAIKADRPAREWVEPAQLDSLDRKIVREAFRTIARVQDSVLAEWHVRVAQL